MAKIQKHIEIVRSNTRGLSSMSIKSATAIAEVLAKHYESVRLTNIDAIDDLKMLVLRKPDLVFLGMKYVPSSLDGKKIWISGYLKDHDITHTGSAERAVKYEQNKPFAKQCLIEAGLSTSPYFVFKAGDILEEENIKLTFPLFVKPTCLGAGQGVDEHSIVYNFNELRTKVDSIINTFKVDALVEEYLPGREFSVAVLKQRESEDFMAMPIEMHPGADVNGDRILSNALKAGEIETPVSQLSEGVLKQKLTELAYGVFKTLGARDYGRIDIKLSTVGAPNFLEANLIPSIINNSGNFQKACLINNGISYEDMLLHIVGLAFDRVETVKTLDDTDGLAAILVPGTIVEAR